jgi:Protein of unknown function (DUF4199)
MKKIVLRYGLISGGVLALIGAITFPLYRNGTLDFDNSAVLGYASMVLAFLWVFFGVRAYRDTVAAGGIGFGKAFQVGILITLITCAIYVISWEIIYYNFFPDFLDQYSAHSVAKMQAAGASAAEIEKASAKMADFAKLYANPFWNSAITFLEIFPVGLIVTLVTAAILRRKSSPTPPRTATA